MDKKVRGMTVVESTGSQLESIQTRALNWKGQPRKAKVLPIKRGSAYDNTLDADNKILNERKSLNSGTVVERPQHIRETHRAKTLEIAEARKGHNGLVERLLTRRMKLVHEMCAIDYELGTLGIDASNPFINQPLSKLSAMLAKTNDPQEYFLIASAMKGSEKSISASNKSLRKRAASALLEMAKKLVE